MRVEVLGIDAATYVPHPLHTDKREWSETNCYVDLWIEVLNALGLDPVAAAAFTPQHATSRVTSGRCSSTPPLTSASYSGSRWPSSTYGDPSSTTWPSSSDSAAS